MTQNTIVTIDGEVERPVSLSLDDLRAIDAAGQIDDVSRIDPKRKGRAVQLDALLALAAPKATGDYLTLHASHDDFHASIPLAAVRDKAIVIYEVDGGQLPESAGGPVRFYVQDHAACHSDEVDECANVKFVDRIELTHGKGYDNRPEDDEQHEALHRDEDS